MIACPDLAPVIGSLPAWVTSVSINWAASLEPSHRFYTYIHAGDGCCVSEYGATADEALHRVVAAARDKFGKPEPADAEFGPFFAKAAA